MNSVACVSNLIVPALISKSALGARIKSPLVVAIVSVFVPAAIVISDTSHSLIFLLPSTITNLLACRVPAAVGKRSVYSVPAIVKTALPVAGLPIYSLPEADEYANSPAEREEGAEVLSLRLI